MSNNISKEMLMSAVETLGIEYIVSVYSNQISQKGDIIDFICPFHSDKRLGAAKGYVTKNDFYCFSCHASGSLWMLTCKFAENLHPEHAGKSEFSNLLSDIARDLGINPETVTQKGFKAQPSINDEVYIALFGNNHETIECEYHPSFLPNGKVVELPTKVHRIFFKRLFLSDKELHDKLVRAKVITDFKRYASIHSIEECEKEKERVLCILKTLLNDVTDVAEFFEYELGNKKFLRKISGQG